MSRGAAIHRTPNANFLASRYRANPARIRQIIDVCGSLSIEPNAEAKPFEIAQDMLARSDELMYGITRNTIRSQTQYDARF